MKVRAHLRLLPPVLALASLTACNSDPGQTVSAYGTSSVSNSGSTSSTTTATNSGSSTTSTSPSTSTTSTVALDAEESAFVGLINDYRAQNGLAPLQVSLTLTESSKWMSGDMAAKDYFSHTDSLGRDPFTRIQTFGYTSYNSAGENIAAGNATASATFTQWKNSPAHNANMLGSSYAVIGVGRAQGGSYGWYWTTDFGSKVDSILQ